MIADESACFTVVVYGDKLDFVLRELAEHLSLKYAISSVVGLSLKPEDGKGFQVVTTFWGKLKVDGLDATRKYHP